MSAILEFIDSILKTTREAETTRIFSRHLTDQIGDCKFILAENGLTWTLPNGFIGSYSEEWMDVYMRRNYHFNDPISQRSLKTMKPFRWSEAAAKSRRSRQIMSLAQDFNLFEGYCFPVAKNGYYAAALSVTGEYLDIPESKLPELQLAMIYYHSRILSFYDQSRISQPKDELLLSRREAQCLSLVAGGKTGGEIGDILSIGETTVHTYVESAKKKLNTVTRAQAVVEAMKLGLIAT